MNHEQAHWLRPVSSEADQAIGPMPQGSFNFGLYFYKWFYVSRKDWKCPTDVPKGKADKGKVILSDNMPLSLRLFNSGKAVADSVRGSWDLQFSRKLLQQKHEALDQYAAAFVKLGYKYVKLPVPLLTPLITGLGNEHPTEKGFRFDWNLGVPVIPASGVKGVVRLAFLVNMLNRDYENDEQGAERFCESIKEDENLPDEVKKIFGYAGEKSARRGAVIFLDAYPESLPRLKAEIMNCHYPDYLGKGQRGPTEDQNPNPQKYWAVDPLLADGNTHVRFVFRMLLNKSIANNADCRAAFEAAVTAALEEHGLGAKTAVGHGRFKEEAQDAREARPATGLSATLPPLRSEPPRPPEPLTETWEGAFVTWNAGNSMLEANFERKKARGQGKELVVESFQKSFFKSKSPRAKVTVIKESETYFRIVKVEAPE